MEELRKRHINLINQIGLDFKRSFINELPWGERLIGIKGSRGIGKTTLLLQYIKEQFALSDKVIYVSLDNFYFANNRLVDFADEFVSKGGEYLFIDEVHKYNNWAVELKNIYDFHPKLKVAFTGSSLLEILNSRADLSRRALVYSMQGLSFREFLQLRHGIKINKITLEQILQNHIEIALKIGEQVKPLKYFDEYLKTGYFPFFNGNEDIYFKQLQEIVNMILEIELPLLRQTDISIVKKIRQLLYILSLSVPFKPNVTTLANKIQITRKTLLTYFNYMSDSELLNAIYKDSSGISLLQKPEKLFFENTNFMFAISGKIPNKGSLRETFFLNQLAQSHKVLYPAKGDFLVDNKYLFEIGGKNKTTKQLEQIENAYIAADDIEFGFGNKIPLWLFGFLY